MTNDTQMPERIWYHSDGAYLPCQPTMHWEWQEYVRADLCASGQQVRADRHQIARAIWDAMTWAAVQGAPDGTLPKYMEWGNSLGECEARRAADRILAALTPAPQAEATENYADPDSSAPQPAGEAVPTCFACEDNPKHPNIPCAVCGAHPPQPSEAVADAAAVILSAIERAQIDMTILRKFMNGEPCAALRALKGSDE